MLSIYTPLFNVIQNDIRGWQKSISLSAEFADELVVAINTSTDNTEEEVRKVLAPYNNWKIVNTSFPREAPMDGQIKNAAMQACSNEFQLLIDGDEYIQKWMRPLLDNLLFQFKFAPQKCLMLPSIDLFRDENHYKSINLKQYITKKGVYRGISNQARNPDGTANTQISDGTEVLNENGNMVESILTTTTLEDLEYGRIPYIIHEGYLHLDSRLNRGLAFWNEHWMITGGGRKPAHIIHESMESFNSYEYKRHNLKLV